MRCALRAGAMLSGVAVWVAMLVLWMLLVGSTDVAEILGGLVSASIAAAGFLAVRARDETRVSFRPRHFAILIRRVPPKVGIDCARVLGAVGLAARGRGVHGRMVRVAFRPGKPDDPDDAARRALVVFGISLAPNTLAARIERSAILEHQLLTAAVDTRDPEWPV